MSKDKSKTIMGMGATTELDELAGPRPSSASDAGKVTESAPPAAVPNRTITATPTGPGSSPLAAPPLTDEEYLLGKELSGYRVERKLGEGGMGNVFFAEHAKIGKRAAIKVLKPEYCRDEQVVQRFYQEARSVNEIRHENIVEVYDFGRSDDGRVYFVMEYLEGENLDDRLGRGALSFREALPILDQILRALQAAHDKGFVHRDLKPENIWLRSRAGRAPAVKLLDFGIAKLVGNDDVQDKLTRTGSIIGTPHYMSPEQIDGSGNIDRRSDLYSLGVIMYELFSGRRPFHGETLQSIIAGHLMHAPPPLENLDEVPAPVVAVVEQLLAKAPADRYQSADEVLGDLQAIAENRAPTTLRTLERKGSTTSTQQTRRPPTRWPLFAAVAAVIVVGAAFAASALLGSEPAPEPTAAAAGAVPEPTTDAPEAVEPPPPIDPGVARASARELLHGALEDVEPAVRVSACDAIGDVRDSGSEQQVLAVVDKDPDAEVRGHAASALGRLGADAAVAVLKKALDDAEPALGVWFAEGLARLGERDGRKRLEKFAKDDDLGVSFKAAMALADVSEVGDDKAIRALKRIAAREAELNDIAPYAGVVILSRLARLGHGPSRDALHSALEHPNQGAQLAAAEALARVGDDSGKEVLLETLQAGTSPNDVVAAAALVELGDYAGHSLLAERLGHDDAGIRRLSARGLGAVGERDDVRALQALYEDGDGRVRVAAAAAVLFVVGLDPALLAQASVDWARGALASDDWAVREAAAGTIGDMPEEEAAPLLASAIADPDPKVRRAAARSAAKFDSADAAKTVAAAAKVERDEEAKKEQVKTLGRMGRAEARPVLAEIVEKDSGTVGVIAAGSLVAVGDESAASRLEQALDDRRTDMRLAAVESATLAAKPVVKPVLERGVSDRKFEVRFAAAEGLSLVAARADAAVPVLQEGLESLKPDVQGRAQAALLRLGVAPGKGLSPALLVESDDPATRRGALPVIAEMPWPEASPLLRRLLADRDVGVKREAVSTLEGFEDTNRQQVVRYFKLLVDDRDPVTRARSQARLARLIDKPKAASAPPAMQPAPAMPAIEDVSGVKTAVDEAAPAMNDLAKATARVDKLLAAVEAATASAAEDEEDVEKVEELEEELQTAAAALGRARTRAADAAKAARAAAGDSPGPRATEMLADLDARLAEANKAAALEGRVADAHRRVDRYKQDETADPDMYLAAADAAIATGKLGAARRDLRKARKLYKAQNKTNPVLDFSYGRLYDKMALAESDAGKRKELLVKAKGHLDAFVGKGSGIRVAQARERSAEIAEELVELE